MSALPQMYWSALERSRLVVLSTRSKSEPAVLCAISNAIFVFPWPSEPRSPILNGTFVVTHGTIPCLAVQQFRQRVGGNKFKELLSPRSMTLRSATTDQEHSISPLAGAVFSSNWVLFREVYDRYEKLAGCCWQRETVRA